MVVWPDDLESEIPNKDMGLEDTGCQQPAFQEAWKGDCKLGIDVKNSVRKVN